MRLLQTRAPHARRRNPTIPRLLPSVYCKDMSDQDSFAAWCRHQLRCYIPHQAESTISEIADPVARVQQLAQAPHADDDFKIRKLRAEWALLERNSAGEDEADDGSEEEREQPPDGPMPDVGFAGLNAGAHVPEQHLRYADEQAWMRAYNEHGRDAAGRMASFVKDQKGVLGDASYALDLSKYDPAALNPRQRILYRWLRESVGHGRPDGEAPQIRAVVRGGGGVGKSYTINCFRRWLCEQGLDSTLAVLAPTGTAAFNVAGRTLHAGLKLPVPLAPSTFHKLENDALSDLQQAFGSVKVLIVDEMSMVGRRTLHILDSRLRQAKAAPDTPFGGVHVFFVGDYGQLPPISDLEMFSAKTRKPCGQRYDNLSSQGEGPAQALQSLVGAPGEQAPERRHDAGRPLGLEVWQHDRRPLCALCEPWR